MSTFLAAAATRVDLPSLIVAPALHQLLPEPLIFCLQCCQLGLLATRCCCC